MDAKQIVILAVIFVAGLVLGNIAGEITGYTTKTTTISISPSIIALNVNQVQQITVTVTPGETIKRDLSVYFVKGNQKLSTTEGIIRFSICGSAYCTSGKSYSTQYTIPQSKENYYVVAYNRYGKEVARAYFTVQ